MNILISGANGSVAQNLIGCTRIYEKDWALAFHYSNDERPSLLKKLAWCDVFVPAISTKDDGSAATSQIIDAIALGKWVVTPEKGSLSEYHWFLRPYLHRMRYSTTVGGPSNLLQFVRPRTGIIHMVAVVNATTTSLWWSMSQGASYEEAEAIAFAQKTAEPDSKNGIGLVNSEFNDGRRKACILHNEAFPDIPVRYSQVGYCLYSKAYAIDMLRRGPLVVRIGKRSNYKVRPRDPCFWLETRTTYLFGECTDDIPEFRGMMPKGIENCITVEHAGDRSVLTPRYGAGAYETAQAIMRELEELEVLVNTSR